MKKRSEYIGLSPLDIYKDRNGNREVYIHLNQESFLKAEKPTITEAIISNEYLKQARKLENMSMKYFENNISKKDFNRIIDIQKKAYEQNYSSEVLRYIFSELETGFRTQAGSEYSINANFGSAEENVEYIYSSLNQALEEMSKIDKLIVENFQLKTTSSINGSLVSLSQIEVSKSRKAFEELLILRRDLQSKGADLDLNKIKSSIRYNINTIKGDMMEVVSACAKQTILNLMEDAILASSELTGDLKIDISKQKKYLKTLSEKTKSSKNLTSKSDSVSFIYDFNPDTGEVYNVGAIGESTKSYKVGTKGSEVTGVSKTPWANLFTFADLINTQFEYAYANSYYHNLNNSSSYESSLNRYLAARTASYVYAGIGNLGSNPPALFLAGTDRAIYLPDLFREMATSPNSQLKIKTEGKGDANTIVNSGSGTPMFNAYIRSKKLMTTLRERIKFKGYLKT